jgi:hypothetical protein
MKLFSEAFKDCGLALNGKCVRFDGMRRRIMKCNEVRERLQVLLPGWQIKIGAKVAVLKSPEGDQMEIENWRYGNSNGDGLYKDALRFQSQMRREKELGDDPVIKELLRQIDARKQHLLQTQEQQDQ